MRFNLIVSDIARHETLSAWEYYEQQRDGLGEEFLASLDDCYKAISRNPYAYSFIDATLLIRDVKIKRFPFVIIYNVDLPNVIILSVHSSHKKPIF